MRMSNKYLGFVWSAIVFVILFSLFTFVRPVSPAFKKNNSAPHIPNRGIYSTLWPGIALQYYSFNIIHHRTHQTAIWQTWTFRLMVLFSLGNQPMHLLFSPISFLAPEWASCSTCQWLNWWCQLCTGSHWWGHSSHHHWRQLCSFGSASRFT